jgi:hypothetical protein
MILITRGRYNRPFSSRRVEWTQLDSTPPLCELKKGGGGSQAGGKRFVDDKEVEAEVQKWLRQQTKDSNAAGFDALVKRWHKFINVGGGYVE